MNLTEEIFNNLKGKATGIFEHEVKTYLEIGVREGNTFSNRVPLVKNKSVAIDCWDLFKKASQNDMGRSKSLARAQYENLKSKYFNDPKVDIIRSFSNTLNVINQFESNYFDVIFIDGDHSYEGVKEDLNNWWDKCNTLFCGHDYMLQKTIWGGVECGVKRAVDEFILQHQDQIKHFRVFTNSSNPTWFIWKK
jgi:hypothetical protein